MGRLDSLLVRIQRRIIPLIQTLKTSTALLGEDFPCFGKGPTPATSRFRFWGRGALRGQGSGLSVASGTKGLGDTLCCLPQQVVASVTELIAGITKGLYAHVTAHEESHMVVSVARQRMCERRCARAPSRMRA